MEKKELKNRVWQESGRFLLTKTEIPYYLHGEEFSKYWRGIEGEITEKSNPEELAQGFKKRMIDKYPHMIKQ